MKIGAHVSTSGGIATGFDRALAIGAECLQIFESAPQQWGTARLDDEQLRNMLAGNANRIADGEPPLGPSPPKGDATFAQPMSLARVHQYLSMATPLLWTRQPDTIGVVGLALNACDERNGRREELEQIKELLTTARDLWRALPEIEHFRIFPHAIEQAGFVEPC